MSKKALRALLPWLLGCALGVAGDRLYLRYWSSSSPDWDAARAAVNQFYAETPGFAEYKAVLQPLIDQQQDLAIRSMKRPPRSERRKDAYVTVVVLWTLAETDLTHFPQGAINVLERALKRRGLNSYWEDPDTKPTDVPK